MHNNSNLDIVYLMVSILSALFGPEMAAIVGPFAVIFLSSIGGAAWSVGRRPPEMRTVGNDIFFFTRLVITAMVVTGGIAVFAERWTGPDTRQWTLPVIALLIGAVGDDWPTVGRSAMQIVGRWATKKADPTDTSNHPGA